MGAQSFDNHVTIKKSTTDKEAFAQARQNAQYDNGHAGYTGTLAEKSDFVMITRAKSRENAQKIANAMMDSWDNGITVYREEAAHIVNDKWGPAGAIRYPIDKSNDGILFFGYASS